MEGVRTPVPDSHTYLAEWSALHGGYDPAGGAWLVQAWLGLVYRVGRRAAAMGLRPGAVTAAGSASAAVAIVPAWAGGRWPLLAAAVVVASGLLDGLDGAVAIITRRVSAWGYVLDSIADRSCDALYLLALWLVGAPGGLVVAAGGVLALLEYLRARAGNAGFGEIGVVTVGERPTRIIVAAVALVGAGAVPEMAAVAGAAGAAATAGVCTVGLAQLVVVVRRALRA
jgi:CDP-diacylglycerol--glycerol-3-phosphate 3-phosphatidyltransferase